MVTGVWLDRDINIGFFQPDRFHKKDALVFDEDHVSGSRIFQGLPQRAIDILLRRRQRGVDDPLLTPGNVLGRILLFQRR